MACVGDGGRVRVTGRGPPACSSGAAADGPGTRGASCKACATVRTTVIPNMSGGCAMQAPGVSMGVSAFRTNVRALDTRTRAGRMRAAVREKCPAPARRDGFRSDMEGRGALRPSSHPPFSARYSLHPTPYSLPPRRSWEACVARCGVVGGQAGLTRPRAAGGGRLPAIRSPRPRRALEPGSRTCPKECSLLDRSIAG